ncbi:MAG: HAD-IA family hydrolase [Candidatus Latescibacteria bacterium]|nr:HAD-IA family hydrolase [Candidatus Latescibacterota bacterium]
MKYKCVIFDFDGTLADTYPWVMSVINQVADKYKFKRVEKNEQETLRGYDAGSLLQHLGVPLWKIPQIANHMRTLMTQNIYRISLFDGVSDLLQRLSENGAVLAVVSSNSYDNVRHVLGQKNVDWIDYYECGVSIFGKPAKLKKIMRKSGIPNSESIYIGDEIRDMEAAKNAKIDFGGVSWGYNNVEALKAHASGVVFSDINEIIEKLGYK